MSRDDRSDLDGEILRSLGMVVLQAVENARLGVSITRGGVDQLERIYVSQSFADIVGRPLAEIRTTTVPVPFPAEELERFRVLGEQRRRGEPVPPAIESVILRDDGTRVPVEIAFTSVVRDEVLFTVAFLRDIRERQDAELALRRSEARFRQLIEAAREGISVARDGAFVYVNPAFAELLGHELPSALVGRPVTEYVDSEDHGVLFERLATMYQSGQRLPAQEYRMLRRDGSRVITEVLSLIIEFEGSPAILAFVRDVTDRRRVQAQLVQTERMATIGTLAAGVAHEINNPLAYVLLNLGLLERELPELVSDEARRERVRATLHAACDGTERVATIVRDLRSLARVGSDARSDVDVRQVLESAANIAANDLRDRARLVRDYSPCPPVSSSAARLGQVALNLLLNAAQAIPEGNPEAHEVRITLRPDGGQHVVFEIRDSGCGIPPELIERVFEPFFTTKPAGVGTGLGLSICQNIVAQLGGQLSVESVVGRGSTFRVRIPSTLTPPSVPALRSLPTTGGRRARVLVVDDEALLTDALSVALSTEHEVSTCSDARQALAFIVAQPEIDVVLCDVMMPGMSGGQLYDEVARLRPELRSRFVFMSGATATPRVAEFLARVDAPHLEKPITLDQLLAVIRERTSKA